MRTSDQTNEISAALSKAQGEIKNPEKNRTAKYPTKTGAMIEYNYADLPACLDAARAALSKNGLSHTAITGFVEDNYTLFVRLTHSSGQWYESEWPLQTGDPKITGAGITYGTRYLFCGLTGMSGDEDMDAPPERQGKFEDRKPTSKPPTATATPKSAHPSAAQIARLWTIAAASGISEDRVRAFLLSEYKATSSGHISLTQYDGICNLMESGRFPA